MKINFHQNLMREPIIHHEHPELEYNLWGNNHLKYKGILFTGTIFFDDTNPVSYVEYKNGEYDGNEIVYHQNGQLAEKNFYHGGRYISGKMIYENGQLRHNLENENIIFDEDGLITKKNNVWYYKSGKARLIAEDLKTEIYTEAGDLAILIETVPDDSKRNPGSQITYCHQILIKDYNNLTDHIYLYPEDNFEFRQLIFVHVNAWIIEVFKSVNRTEAIHIVNKMISESDNRLKQNLDYRIESVEKTFIHNSKIFIKRLEKGDYDNLD